MPDSILNLGTPPTNGAGRPPPKAVRMLLPVWGFRFIKQFLDYSLPTMLAPGNIPAVSKALPCTFVFLTSEQDADFLRSQPGYHLLSSICRTEIEPIDDLITGDNYSTTITLSYERAIRQTGDAMLDTCFFFLISDYLVADGSFANVLARMQRGVNGLQAGNFQVVSEEAGASFYERFEQDTPEMVLPARDLMAWALRYLHAMTAANMVNFPLCHTSHTNRLFWRADDETIIGRFFLLHMICVRPELTDFVIGSSCDYSFIPEMCPSGNTEVLTDSDEYLVVEMQPRDHERGLIKLGPLAATDLATSLNEWTTARHRQNSDATIIFHAGEIPASVSDTVAEADAFLADVRQALQAEPQPYRDHPYWIGAMEAHLWAKARRSQRHSAETPARPDAALRWSFVHVMQNLRQRMFGRPPFVRPWHPRWPDYHMLGTVLDRLLLRDGKGLLVLARDPTYYRDWVEEASSRSRLIATSRLLEFKRAELTPLVGSFDGCLMLMDEDALWASRAQLRAVLPLVRPGGFILISIINGRGASLDDGFENNLARFSSQFLMMTTPIEATTFVPAGALRRFILRELLRLNQWSLKFPLAAVALAPFIAGFAFASYVANVASLRQSTEKRTSAGYSSLCLELRPATAHPLPQTDERVSGYWTRKGRRNLDLPLRADAEASAS